MFCAPLSHGLGSGKKHCALLGFCVFLLPLSIFVGTRWRQNENFCAWMKKYPKKKLKRPKNLFSVKDFVGDACKRISSRIRGVVSAVSFDNFHKNSTEII
jgi:hypothetical protein